MPTQQTQSPDQIMHVLIVDDMPQVRQELHKLLELSSMVEVVGEASNGLQAISLSEKLSPDVVIMDLEMPEMDGFQATLQIKERHLAKRVVVLSVHTEVKDIERALHAGADAFVLKGADLKSILNALRPT
jgi:DNA-binding NarL/FixJ family response regulator